MANMADNELSDRLLDLLSLILNGEHYKPLGAPPLLLRGDAAASIKDFNTSEVSFQRHFEDILTFLSYPPLTRLLEVKRVPS